MSGDSVQRQPSIPTHKHRGRISIEYSVDFSYIIRKCPELVSLLRRGCDAEAVCTEVSVAMRRKSAVAGSGASDQALMWGSSRSGDVGVKVKAGDVGVSRWG